ncbi:hypothetical protein ACFQ0D_01850 [Micromonospora zhanjiangensis]
MPVSRKRKKKRSSKPVQRTGGRRLTPGQGGEPFGDMFAERRRLDASRQSVATKAAQALLPELVELATTRTGTDLEDALCERFGPLMLDLDRGSLGEDANPLVFLDAVIGVTAEAVLDGLDDDGPQSAGWQGPWRLLVGLGGLTPYPLMERFVDAVARVRAAPGGRVLPALPDGPAVAGTVLWARDAYGSRFAVVAPIATAEGSTRWYLWDVDACGFTVVTVDAGYQAGPDEALARWRTNVGEVAGGAATLTPVDDGWLLSELLPVGDEGMMRFGGDGLPQMMEYHRCRRLADEVRAVVGRAAPGTTGYPLKDAAAAAAAFTDWRAANRPEAAQHPEYEELVQELAESWSNNGPVGLSARRTGSRRSPRIFTATTRRTSPTRSSACCRTGRPGSPSATAPRPTWPTAASLPFARSARSMSKRTTSPS